MLDIIKDNPYRILGVYSTSQKKEIVANQGRMKAFLHVGKNISFPLDLPNVLPTISRTEGNVKDAAAKLTLPADQVRYAQFWFAKVTQFDDIACAKLTNGDIDGAIGIWSKKDNASSLQNRIVCALISEQYDLVISYAERLYSNYLEDFLRIVLGDNATISSDDLAHDFLNVLCDGVGANAFLQYITIAEWKQYVSGKSIQPLIDAISTAISTAKASKGNGATARYDAGVKLMNETKNAIKQMRTSCSISKGVIRTWSLLDFASKNGKMQVGSFTNSSTGEHFKSCIFTSAENKKTYVLFSYRLGVIAVSEIQERKNSLCVVESENEFILCDKTELDQFMRYQMIADKLGLEILQCGIDYYNDSNDRNAAHKAMILQSYAQSIVVGKMAKDRCKENVDILNDIIANLPPAEVFDEDRRIKEKLRNYRLQPQNIANAISLLKSCAPILLKIKEKIGKERDCYIDLSTAVVNNALNNVIEEINGVLGNKEIEFSSIKKALISAWHATLYMDKFDLRQDFKQERYNENRQSLYNIIEQAKGFEPSSMSILYQYGCGWCNDLDVSDLDMRTDDEIFANCHLCSEYESYLKKFPQGKHVLKAKEEIEKEEYKRCTTKQACIKFLAKYPSSKYIKSVKDKILEIENREKKQNAAIQACTKFTEVLALYEREKNYLIDVQKCSVKAFELAKTEDDFNRIVKVFGRYTQGGKLAQNKLNEIESKRKKDKEKRQKTIKWMLIIGIPLAIIFIIYLIWGIRGLSVGCFIIAFLAFCAINGAMKEGEGSGCLVAIGVTFVFGLIGYGLSSIADETEKTNDAKDLYKQILSNPTSELCSKYMDNYGNTEKSSEVNTIWLNILIDNARKFNYKEYTQKDYASRSEENPLCALCNFAEKNSGTQYEKKAQICVSEICDSLYNVACKKNTLNSWETYRAVVPSENYYRDSEDRINKIENYNWNTEVKAWKQANAENTASSYEKYLGLYPQGQHHTQAEKRLVDMQVNSIYAGDHGELPAMEQTSYTESSASYVTISNNTSYTLTILYSGPSSKRLVIEPNGNGSLSLKSGSYTIAAYVSDASVRRFAGREILSGGSYNASYYISQSPY